MGDGFAPWMAFLYATAIRISVVLLITLVALKLLRRASAASRSLVYAAAIVLIVAVPFGKKMPALYPAEVLPSVLAAPLVEAGILSFATTLQPIVRELGGEPVQQAALASATLLVVVVLVVWFCGFAFVLARTVLQWRRMVHIQRTASVCSDRQLNELLAAAQRSIGYSAQVRLLVHDTHDAPFSWCVLRPVMVCSGHSSGNAHCCCMNSRMRETATASCGLSGFSRVRCTGSILARGGSLADIARNGNARVMMS